MVMAAGQLNYRMFLFLLVVCGEDDPEDKLSLLFHLYDTDGVPRRSPPPARGRLRGGHTLGTQRATRRGACRSVCSARVCISVRLCARSPSKMHCMCTVVRCVHNV